MQCVSIKKQQLKTYTHTPTNQNKLIAFVIVYQTHEIIFDIIYYH